MRELSPTLVSKIDQQYGLDPILLLEVQWAIDGPIKQYKGEILTIGSIDGTLQIDNGASANQCTVVLDDVDGSIKGIIDSLDIHKRSGWIYQGFRDIEDKFLLMNGQISSPIIWDEGARTIQFELISKIEDAEVGFSIEEGQFPLLPKTLIGEAWPLVFGSCLNVPALRITSPREGLLASSFGIRDWTLAEQLRRANNIYCDPSYFGGIKTVANDDGTGFVVQPNFTTSNDCAERKCTIIESIKHQRNEQAKYEYPTLIIYGGAQFQQTDPIKIAVGGAYLTGTFNGNTFTVISRIHPDLVEMGVDTVAAGLAIKIAEAEGPDTVKSKCGPVIEATVIDKSGDSFQFVDDCPTSEFAWVPAGSLVTFAVDEETIYVANILPTSILRVAAWRTVDGRRQLLTVPPEYYTTRLVDYTSYVVTEIVFARPLSQKADGWEDDIFVTQLSTVGPNTVDIMRWLITKYSDYEIDEPSFAEVKDALEKYPMHFPLNQRKDLLSLLRELAFQARCSITLRNDKFFLKYLSAEPDADGAIDDEDDISDGTLQIKTTTTEQIVTKFTATWQEDFSKDEPNKLILRHNVISYGTQAQDFDMYAYSDLDLVEKSSIFWLIRYSHTWRVVAFKTALHKLALEPGDVATLTIPALADVPVKGIIQKAIYNPDDNNIDFEIWTPVLSGTRVPYTFAFPSTIDETLNWPPDDDFTNFQVGSGKAPGFTTVAPPNHQLSTTPTSTDSAGDEISYTMGPGVCDQPLPTGSFASTGIRLGFCCDSGFNKADFCEKQKPKSQNDKQDKKPDPKGNTDNSGEINTGKEPKFKNGKSPNELKEKVDKSANQAQKADDRANGANEAAGGPGSSKDPANKPTNPYTKLPKPADAQNPKKDPNDPRPTCMTTITYSWFPIKGINHPGGGQDCVPAGPSRVEKFYIAGRNHCDKMPDPPDCDDGYVNSPCCHMFRTCSFPGAGSCAESEKDGQLIAYETTKPDEPSVIDPATGGFTEEASTPGPG